MRRPLASDTGSRHIPQQENGTPIEVIRMALLSLRAEMIESIHKRMEIPADLIEKARADLAKARTQERRAQDLLNTAQAERVRLEHFFEQLERYSAEKPAADDVDGRGSKTKEIVSAAIDIVTMASAPVSIGDLYDALIASSIEIGGEQPKSNLAGFLSRASARGANIQFIKGEGWAPKKRPGSGLFNNDAPESPSPPRATVQSQPRARFVVPPGAGGGPSWDKPKSVDLDDDIPF